MYRTTLGLDERLERVLAYLFGWVSGLFLFLVEKNRTVRQHAAQSMVTFGTLSILIFVASLVRSMLHMIPLLNIVTDFGLTLLINILLWAVGILWVWLMAMAWLKPDYRLPLVGQWVRYFV